MNNDDRRAGPAVAEIDEQTVPAWILATDDVAMPPVNVDGRMTPQRLEELRSALAAFVDAPIATLEVRPLPTSLDFSRGTPLGSASPLAQQLTELIDRTVQAGVSAGIESAQKALFRMVIPARVVDQFGAGFAEPASVPDVGDESESSAGAVEVIKFAATAVGVPPSISTVAAQLITMAVAAGISTYTGQRREVLDLLEKIQQDNLKTEWFDLNGCRSAIDRAAAVLLDEGQIGETLGLGPAVHTVDKAVARTEGRLAEWQQALDGFQGRRVELGNLERRFGNFDDAQNEFHSHLRLAALAIKLKRRIEVLQATQHAQLNPGNSFESFTKVLNAGSERLNQLESGINDVLRRLSTIEVDRSKGLRDFAFSAGEVDKMLRTTYRLRELGERLKPDSRADVAIEIARSSDGSVVVFPAAQT